MLNSSLGKVVAIGGGTGLPVLLESLKPSSMGINFEKLSAIVTVSDSGGSSGRLRRDMNTLSPGDIRNCLIALSGAPELLRNLFQYRFTSGELEGHSFGNLFIVALAEVLGDFALAVEKLHDILAIEGEIFPSSEQNIELFAKFEDGRIVKGEENIPKANKKIVDIWIEPKDCSAPIKAVNALKEANLILLGPGSLYTSVIPNLLVKDIQNAILESKARKVYICNLVTQCGETDNYKASDHIKAIFRYGGGNIVDTILCNNKEISTTILKHYREAKSDVVEIDDEELFSLGVSVVKEDLLLENEYIRHDPKKLRKTITKILNSMVEKK